MKKYKIISLLIMIVFVFSSINIVFALSQPRINLDDYQINITTKKNVYVSGTVSISKGQKIVITKNGKEINSCTVKNTGGTTSFKLKIPKSKISKGTNTFKVVSKAKFLSLAKSNEKQVTVIYAVKSTTKGKKKPTITCSGFTVYKGATRKLNAKSSSGMKCYFKSSKPKVATINSKGIVTGKKAGTTKITVKCPANRKYKAGSKTVTITVKLGKEDDMLAQAKNNKGSTKYVVITQVNYNGTTNGRTKVYNTSSWAVERNCVSTGAKKNQNTVLFKLQGSKNTDYKDGWPRQYDRDGSVKDKNGKAKYHEYFVVMYKKGENKPAIHTYLYNPGSKGLYTGSEQKVNKSGTPYGNLSNGCTRVNYSTGEFIYRYCDSGTPYKIYYYN